LDDVPIRELIPTEDSLATDEHYTMFHPSEIELSETTRAVLNDIEQVKPVRVVLDSLSEFRLLSGSEFRFRRQLLALKNFFSGRGCTVLLLDDNSSATTRDPHVQSIAHAAIQLEQMIPEYGIDRRRLRVVKYRGMQFRGGYHDYIIQRGGIAVFPRLVASDTRAQVDLVKLSSGLDSLDSLLGGGIERGTSTLIVGAAGTGKSTLAAQVVAAAAQRGENAAYFAFDESISTLLSRADGLGIDLRQAVEAGHVALQQIDPAELSPGEFTHSIRRAVEERQVTVVVIDSLNGYLNAMPGERYLTIQLHEILMFLGQAGVASILIGAHQGLIGGPMITPVDASYLSDAVILLRYFELKGEVRQAISVVKKRGGAHERTIREFSLAQGRIVVGEPLHQFRGVLTGVPTYESASARQTATEGNVT
jgi:circadian clock protein KaiC